MTIDNLPILQEPEVHARQVLCGIALVSPLHIFNDLQQYLKSNYPDNYEMNTRSCASNGRPDPKSIVYEMLGRLPNLEILQTEEYIKKKYGAYYSDEVKKHQELMKQPLPPNFRSCPLDINDRSSLGRLY